MRDQLKAIIAGTTFFTFSCVFDHITTLYGLLLPNVTEMNAHVLLLMGFGIWHLIETMIIIAGISSGCLASISKSDPILKLSTIALMSGGLVRFSAGIQNIAIILNALT